MKARHLAWTLVALLAVAPGLSAAIDRIDLRVQGMT